MLKKILRALERQKRRSEDSNFNFETTILTEKDITSIISICAVKVQDFENHRTGTITFCNCIEDLKEALTVGQFYPADSETSFPQLAGDRSPAWINDGLSLAFRREIFLDMFFNALEDIVREYAVPCSTPFGDAIIPTDDSITVALHNLPRGLHTILTALQNDIWASTTLPLFSFSLTKSLGGPGTASRLAIDMVESQLFSRLGLAGDRVFQVTDTAEGGPRTYATLLFDAILECVGPFPVSMAYGPLLRHIMYCQCAAGDLELFDTFCSVCLANQHDDKRQGLVSIIGLFILGCEEPKRPVHPDDVLCRSQIPVEHVWAVLPNDRLKRIYEYLASAETYDDFTVIAFSQNVPLLRQHGARLVHLDNVEKLLVLLEGDVEGYVSLLDEGSYVALVEGLRAILSTPRDDRYTISSISVPNVWSNFYHFFVSVSMTIPPPRDMDASLPRAIALGVTALLVCSLGQNLSSSFFPSYRELVHCDAVCYGYYQSFQSGVTFVGALAMGHLSDEYGRFPALYIGIVATIISCAISFSGNNITYLILAQLPLALNQNQAIMKALFSDYADMWHLSETRRAAAVGYLGMATGVSLMAGPIVGALMFPSYAHTKMGMGFLALISGTIIHYLPAARQEAKITLSQGTLHSVTDSSSSSSSSSMTIRKAMRNVLQLFSTQCPAARLLLFVKFCLGLAFSAYSGMFMTSLKDRFDFSPLQYGMLMAWLGLSFAVSQGLIAKYCIGIFRNDTKLLMTCVLIMGIGRTIQMITPSQFWMYVITFLVVLCYGVVETVMSTACSMIADAHSVGTLYGNMDAAKLLAGLFGPTMGGYLFREHHLLPLLIDMVIFAVIFVSIRIHYRNLVTNLTCIKIESKEE